MTKKFFITALVAAASLTGSAAYACPEGAKHQHHHQDSSMWDDATPTVPGASMAEDAPMNNDVVKCWGWDGSKGGTDIKKVTRSECFSEHGEVATPGLIPQAAAKKK